MASAAASLRESQEDHRFAELAARTGLEPELARRYAEEPLSVLLEFGLAVSEPVYLSEILTQDVALIEDLEPLGVDMAAARFTWCVIEPTVR